MVRVCRSPVLNWQQYKICLRVVAHCFCAGIQVSHPGFDSLTELYLASYLPLVLFSLCFLIINEPSNCTVPILTVSNL